MKTLGIIGGMGPQATIDLYQKITDHTAATRDQDHLHILIDSYPQIPDRTAHICGSGDDPLPYLVRSARRLEAAGAELLLMPCNAAHHYIRALRERTILPFLHIADCAIATLSTRCPPGSRVAVLSTRGTRHSGLYRDALQQAGYHPVEPDEVQTAALMRCIYDGAKAGNTAAYAPLLAETVATIAADSLILACTELPLFLPWWQDSRPVIDSTDALARAAVAAAREAA